MTTSPQLIQPIDPRDFGAVADGETKDTQAIQAAIDAASLPRVESCD